MTRTSAGMFGGVLCALVVGFLFGVALDARYRPDQTTLYLQYNTKMSVQPRSGDVVRWVSFEGSSHVPDISFTAGNAPCHSPITAGACWYDPSPGFPFIALYDCSLDGSPGACADPGVGPKSGTGGGGGPIETKQPPPSFLTSYLIILRLDFARLFGSWPELTPEILDALAAARGRHPAGTIAPAKENAVPANPAPANPPPPRGAPKPAAVNCYNGNPGVFVPGTNPPQKYDPIHANPKDIVSWYPVVASSISGLSICNLFTSPDGTINCKINDGTPPGSYPYTVTIDSCTNKTGSFSIQVP